MKPTSKSRFHSALIKELLLSCYNYFGEDNWEEAVFGTYTSSVDSPELLELKTRCPDKFAVVPKSDAVSVGELDSILEREDGLSMLYDLLGDEYSKNTLIKVLAYRILGYRKVKLPIAFQRRAIYPIESLTARKNNHTNL